MRWRRRRIIDRGGRPYWSEAKFSVGTTSNHPIGTNNAVGSIGRSTQDNRNLESKKNLRGLAAATVYKFLAQQWIFNLKDGESERTSAAIPIYGTTKPSFTYTESRIAKEFSRDQEASNYCFRL